MKILIYATAAEMGGAITILNHFYDLYNNTKDETVFITSNKLLQNSTNIQILSYPKIKKSWLYRIYFYWFVLPKIVKKINPEKILSLNNTKILFNSIEQTIYLHQTLPFSSYKPNVFSDTYLWVVKNIIGKFIIFSIKKAEYIITQSQWLKNLLINNYAIDEFKITVDPPNFLADKNYRFKSAELNNIINLFYPAGYSSYKNHYLIVDVLKTLDLSTLKRLKITFTLNQSSNKKVHKMYSDAYKNHLPIDFVGYLKPDQIIEYYKHSILLFPSEVESFGLPLLEARMGQTPVICLDTVFAREILEGYSKVIYFTNKTELVEILKEIESHISFLEAKDV